MCFQKRELCVLGWRRERPNGDRDVRPRITPEVGTILVDNLGLLADMTNVKHIEQFRGCLAGTVENKIPSWHQQYCRPACFMHTLQRCSTTGHYYSCVNGVHVLTEQHYLLGFYVYVVIEVGFVGIEYMHQQNNDDTSD